jgi:hypothetical protein
MRLNPDSPQSGLVPVLNVLGGLRSAVVITTGVLSAFWLAFAILASIVPYGPGLMNRYGGPAGGDFVFFYAAGVLSHEGHPDQVYDTQALTSVGRARIGPGSPELVWPYPPTISLPLSVLGWFPPGIALILWIGLAVVSLLLVARITLGSWWLAPAALLFPGSAFALFAGQLSPVLALLLVLALRYSATSPALGGGALGLFVWKPHFAFVPVVFTFLERRWRMAAAAAGIAVLMVAMSVGVFGAATWVKFFHAGLQQSTVLYREAPIGRFVTIFAAAYTWGASIRVALVIHALLALVAGTLGWSLWSRTTRPSTKALALTLTMVIVPPYALDYDLAFLVIPWLLMIRESRNDPRMARSLFWPWLALAGVVPISHIVLLAISRSVAGPMVFAILLASWWSTRRTSASSVPSLQPPVADGSR